MDHSTLNNMQTPTNAIVKTEKESFSSVFKSLHQRQKTFFASNKTKDISFRKKQLTLLQNVLREHEKEMEAAIYKDFCKSSFEVYATEIAILHAEIKTALKKLNRWAKPKRAKTNLANLPASSKIYPEPLGNCFIIGAWNYPFNLSIGPAIAAIAAGNTVVLKPSELPQHSAKIMAKMINENFEADYFHVVEGSVAETTALLDLKWDKIFFTGSTNVGRIVYQAAAKHLTPVTLELGGKSPTIILADTNLKMTVKRIVWAKFTNAGQTCIAPDYLYVHHDIKAAFIKALLEEINLRYSEQNEDYSNIINQRHFDRLQKLIDPSKVIYGGETNPENNTIRPTVMDNVTWEDAVMGEEIFGPILPILYFTAIEEVIAAIKERPKPLSLYLYTKNKKTCAKVLQEVSFGGGAINDSIMHISNPHLPFGGVGESGMGNYHDEAGFKAFSHYKSILKKPFWLEPDVKYPPYTSFKRKLLKFLLE